MIHQLIRAAGARGLVALALGLAGTPPSASALPLLSEVFYDAAGSDNGLSFVELYGAPGTELTGFELEGINDSNGASGPVVVLAGTIPADGFFVVADDQGDGTTSVADADLVVNFDFQNGPDSVVLVSGGSAVDALGYGAFGAGDVFAGEGAPAPDPPAGSSLERLFANVDTDDNAADFAVLAAPTPGSAPLLAIPEPATAGSVLAGLALLGVLGNRRRPRA